jgi:alpha-N-arabinofuranosidase
MPRTRWTRGALLAVSAGALLLTTTPAVAQDAQPLVLVQANRPGAALSPLLTGVNNDQWFDNSHGLWNSEPGDGEPDQDVVAKTARAGIGLVRYPGGTPASFFDWKRAIGPTEQRGCQTDARPGSREPRDSGYGPDEHMEFVAAADAEASIVVPFVRQTPQDAADWVEYMNAPVGANPGGGTDWGQVRAENGHPQPYGVRFWEIGNEHDRPEQRYWMSDDTDTALQQYAFGGTQQQPEQLLGKGCDFTDDVASDGTAGQVFGVPYPPVVPGSAALNVGGEAWTEVPDLAVAGPDDAVYQLDPATGAVRFGDGVHGRIPPAGSQVRATYVSGPHPGYFDIVAAMKAVDPTVDICATWAPITPETGLGTTSFPEAVAGRGTFDCLVVHPYTNFRRQFGDTLTSARQGHDWHMLGEAEATRILATHAEAVRTHGPADAYTTVSEFGALFFGPHNAREYRSWNTAMSHATYFASQWTRLAALGVPWAEGNTLVSEVPRGLRAVLGGEPRFVFTSEAVVREALRPVVEGGGTVVEHAVQGNPQVAAEPTAVGSSYPALAVLATRDDAGTLHVMVVNRSPDTDITARVVPAEHRTGGPATVTSVIGENTDPNRESFESHNSIDHPGEVTLRTETVDLAQAGFERTFPKHSVTIVSLPGAK